MANRLIHEKSRYLRMHAENPVDWYPWGEEAFRKAEREGKPLLISIGYSSCHWCHVMAHESFEDPSVAEILNRSFVAIKIDKEEYPDLDGFYMEYASRRTGSGGWPLNVFATPGRAPFYSFTYLPSDRFKRVLVQTAEKYGELESLRDQKPEQAAELPHLGDEKVREIVQTLEPDNPYGGDGPRFPMPLYYAWCAGFTAREDVQDGVQQFLENSITKGLFDHIQGGWFRYTVDPDWKIPHFEKMLYDQSTMLYLCTKAYTTNTRLCDYAIRLTTRWLREHMKLPTGLYGSATDADTEQGEGFYYTIEDNNSPEVRSLFRLAHAGTHEDRHVPWMDLEYAGTNPVESERIRGELELKRMSLIPPELDDKVVTGWNAFLGYVFLLCYKRLGDQDYLDLADEIYSGLSPFTRGPRIPHVIYGSEASSTGHEYLSDYAAYLLLVSEFSRYRSELTPEAERILELIRGEFVRDGRLYHTTGREFESLSLWQDVPFPSGGSMFVQALLRMESPDIVPVMQTASGVLEYARHNPEFFPLWLQSFSKFYRD